MVDVGDGYCALRDDGSVVCGGVGTNTDPSCPESPQCGQGEPPSDSPPFAPIAVGYRHSRGLSLRDDGVPSVRCWGYSGGGRTNPTADLAP
ncbi:MAG TPA: hypothetical protein VEX18_14720 [Polyangiaceae bacterium]|nr:hypothetical protein [Polyangiaceae bacterium]